MTTIDGIKFLVHVIKIRIAFYIAMFIMSICMQQLCFSKIEPCSVHLNPLLQWYTSSIHTYGNSEWLLL